MAMKSYLTDLECTFCGNRYPADRPIRTCPDCGKVLYPRYDLDAARRSFDRASLPGRPPNMWRYFEVMPIRDESNVVTLGEGFTPLLRAERLGREMGARDILIKDEGVNPTASFKARGLSAAVSKAKELGLTKLTMPSAGNAGGALAAYAARAGHRGPRLHAQGRARGQPHRGRGRGSARHPRRRPHLRRGRNLTSQLAAEHGRFDVSTLQEPYRVEGKKTMGYELAEQLGWTLPDAIVYPTGGGTGIVGFWKAFEEMEQLGWTDGRRPRMYSVQPEGCAPIVRAFHQGKRFAEPWQDAHTLAAGMRVPAAIGDYLMLDALRESGGGAVAVTDDEILEWVPKVSSLEGIFVCPEGAATAAALSKLLHDGTISPNETVLLLNTGSGLKYLDVVRA